MKSNSSEICWLIANFSVIQLQLELTKLKLEVLSLNFSAKKERYEHR